jgi:hypothetical protein
LRTWSPDATGSEPRYGLRQTFAQYGWEKLTARGDAGPLARRHAAAFLDLAERLEAEYESAPSTSWFARVEREIANWQSALRWTLEARQEVLLGQRFVAADNQFECGNIDQAVHLATSGFIAVRQFGTKTNIAMGLIDLAAYCIAAQRWLAAHGYAHEAVKIMRETQDHLFFGRTAACSRGRRFGAQRPRTAGTGFASCPATRLAILANRTNNANANVFSRPCAKRLPAQTWQHIWRTAPR